ncbi:MAG: hypothetical protein JNK04_01380, partial [Myxococcales bacterium]|nr:hypothetical protein [Myxococcales bacterium]
MASGLPAGSGLDTARELAEAAKTAYAGTKHACERTVVRWEWGTFVLHSLDPAYFELHKVRRGAPLASEPDPPVSGARGYGFDE